MLQTGLLCDSGEIVFSHFTSASPCVTRGVLLTSLAGGSTRCLPVGLIKSFETAAFERWTVLLQWVLDDWTCLTALCGAKKWVGLCIVVTKGRQFLRQLLKLNSIYHFNARVYFNLDTYKAWQLQKLEQRLSQAAMLEHSWATGTAPGPALSFGFLSQQVFWCRLNKEGPWKVARITWESSKNTKAMRVFC